jgi:hypothetical protein
MKAGAWSAGAGVDEDLEGVCGLASVADEASEVGGAGGDVEDGAVVL